MSTHQFPNEIIIEILSRLPSKSLLRFRCISKSWYATITHPSFIKMHLTRSRSFHDASKTSYLIHMPPQFPGRKLCTLYSDKTIVEHSKLEIPFDGQSESSSFTLVGSCDGLLCLTDIQRTISGHAVYIWNPSIQTFKIFRFYDVSHPVHRRITSSYLGFGFDSRHNDYKVVTILYFGNSLHTYSDDTIEVRVYSQSTNSCRELKDDVPCLVNYYQPQATIFDGAMHWTGTKVIKGQGCVDLIMTFDISNEVFDEILLPVHHNDGRITNFYVGKLNESLSLVRTVSNECNIWIMKEYGNAESWSKIYSITVDTGFWRLVGFVGHTIVFENSCERYALYNLENEEYKDLGLRGWLWKLSQVTVMDSLILLGQRNPAVELENLLNEVACPHLGD